MKPMFTFNDKVKNNMERKIGLSVDAIRQMSSEHIDAHIESRVGKKLRLAHSADKRLKPRGSVYLNTGRILSSRKITLIYF